MSEHRQQIAESDSVRCMTRVLVTGTDRPLGQAVLPRMLRHGFTAVAAIGDVAGEVVALDSSRVIDHDIVVDLDTHSSIKTALADIDALVHTADSRPGANSSIVDAARAMASACAETDTHLIFVSRVGTDVSSLDHRKDLWQAEQIVEATHGLGYTIQRITHTHDAAAALFTQPWLPLPKGAAIQPVAPADVAGRIVGLVHAGPSERVRDYGGPELISFAQLSSIHDQVRGSLPRRVPLPKFGVFAEAINGVHVTINGDRGRITYRHWLTEQT